MSTVSLTIQQIKALSATANEMPFNNPHWDAISHLAFQAECAAMDVPAKDTEALAWKLRNIAAEIDGREAEDMSKIAELPRWVDGLVNDMRRIIGEHGLVAEA